ncbi:putative transposase, partial [Phenoliferia sp. Uapishka_3]
MSIVDRNSGQIICTGTATCDGIHVLDVPQLPPPPPNHAHLTRNLALTAIPYDLAHRRFAHINPTIVKKLNDTGLIDCGEPKDNHPDCLPCIKGKAQALPYPRTTHHLHPPNGKFAHLATDLQDFGTLSYDRKRYNFLVIDARTKSIISIPIEKKSDAFDELKKVVARIECQNSAIRVTRITSDPGGEYVSGEMLDWCEDKGIDHVMGAAGKHKDNANAERANRIMVEGSRAMLIDANLADRFWSAAIRYRTLIYNRVFNKRGIIPFQEATGHLLDLSDYRVFGCDAESLAAAKNRKKSGSKTKSMVLIGINPLRRGWIIWNLKTGKEEARSDVYFLEKSKVVQADRSSIEPDSDEEGERLRRALNSGKCSESESGEESEGDDEQEDEQDEVGNIFEDARANPEEFDIEEAPYGPGNLRRSTRTRQALQAMEAIPPEPPPPPLTQLNLPEIDFPPDATCEDDLIRALIAKMPSQNFQVPSNRNRLIEPKSMIEALKGPDRIEWLQARNVKLTTLRSQFFDETHNSSTT